MTAPLRIYVAGPYTAPTLAENEAHVLRSIDISLALLAKGHFPFIPHLTHYVEMRAKERNIRISWEEYMRWDEQWLRQCDALFYIAPSRGADMELGLATKFGLTIFRDLAEVPDLHQSTGYPK